jgi:hypothetical protein
MADQDSDSAPSQSQDLYERYAREINISAETLRKITILEDWVDHIDLKKAITS